MNDRLLDIFNDVEEKHWWFVGRRCLLKLIVEKYFNQKKNLRILDVGCGSGGNFEFLSNYGEVHGVDNSLLAIKYAKNKAYKSLSKAEAERLPFPKQKFDLVLLLDVVEHIKDDKKALSEAKRVLKSDGAIIITAPAMPFIWSKHDQMQGHYRRYTKKMFRSLSQDTALKLVYIKYFNFFLALPISIIRILSRLNLFNKLGEYDSRINFSVVNLNIVNNFLASLFKKEISFLEKLNYPLGISLVAVLKK